MKKIYKGGFLATLLVGIILVLNVVLNGGAIAAENKGYWKCGALAIIGTICILLSIFFAAYLYSMHEVNKFVNHPENYQVDTLMSNGQIKEIIVYRK